MEPFQKAVGRFIGPYRTNFEVKGFGNVIVAPPFTIPFQKISPLGSPHTHVELFDECRILNDNLEYTHDRLFTSLLYPSILGELRFKRRGEIATNGLAAFMHQCSILMAVGNGTTHNFATLCDRIINSAASFSANTLARKPACEG